MPVAEALDRVLEILRTTELYSPQLGTKDEDPHTNDLVGGLMTVSGDKLLNIRKKGCQFGDFLRIQAHIFGKKESDLWSGTVAKLAVLATTPEEALDCPLCFCRLERKI